MIKYGLNWPDNYTPLNVEIDMIRAGGKIERGGKSYGEGLFHHYRCMMTLLWPEDDHHRWSDSCLKRKTEHEVLILMGSGDSNKTYFSSKYVLCNWWVLPFNTLWIISSTELRGAELRNWGAIKGLFNRARERYPWLPGVVLESKTCITPDVISEGGITGRLLTKGIIFVPCKKGGQWVGMGAYAGVKPPKGGRLGHFGDECFVGGTLIDTPNGLRPIENIKAGDFVISALGVSKVSATMHRIAKEIVIIKCSNGAQIQCTPNHPLLTPAGWKKACELNVKSFILNANEAMRILQGKNKGHPFLQSVLSSEVAAFRSGVVREASQEPTNWAIEIPAGASRMEGDRKRQAERQETFLGSEKETIDALEGIGIAPPDSRRERKRTNESGEAAFANSSEWDMGVWDQNRKMEREWIPPDLQSGSGYSEHQTGNRGRWEISQPRRSKIQGCEERQILKGAWVDSIEIHQCPNLEFPNPDSGNCGYRVYNLQVDGHPSYSVSGLLVHNCSFMHPTFLNAYANWYGKAFEAILDGNPTDLDDPLCTAAKPIGGWDAWKDTGKTQEWLSTFYNAWVIALDGRDSPNMDRPKTLPPRYPYLIHWKKHEAVLKLHGPDHPLYWQQCVGKPLPGTEKFRVIPHSLPEQSGAHDPVVWEGSDLTDIVSLDAAYGGEGGDRCILTHIRFGADIEGRDVIEVKAQVPVPVAVQAGGERVEKQIAKFCKTYCEGYNIPPANFYFDGRSTLAVTFAQVWSAEVNVVDFGGPATKRPVSQDEFLIDAETGEKRLKRCDEHYSKFVTELWFTIYYLMIGKQLRNLPKECATELRRRIWRFVTKSRIEVETKKEMKERLTESPDLADSLVTAVEGARRQGFLIAILKDIAVPEEDDEDWLDRELAKHRKFMQKNELKSRT